MRNRIRAILLAIVLIYGGIRIFVWDSTTDGFFSVSSYLPFIGIILVSAGLVIISLTIRNIIRDRIMGKTV